MHLREALLFIIIGCEIITAIVFKLKLRTLRVLNLMLLGFLLVGCSVCQPLATITLGPPPKMGSPTPTDFMPPTVTQGTAIWLSPSLPPAFREAWEAPLLKEYGFDLVGERSQAFIRVEPSMAGSLATWIYALVAPFPTTLDGMSWGALQSLWSGSESLEPLFIGDGSHTMLETVFGPAGENVRIVKEETLIDLAWGVRPAYAIVPFEALEPRWKVLALEGQSPIRKDFDLGAYPLKAAIGIEGPSDAEDLLRKMLDLPQSNRDPDRLTVLVMTGVTALTRATAWQMERRGVDFPAEKIGSWLVEADLTHISNEVVFASSCPYPDPEQEGLKFCSYPDYIELLDIIGTDIVELTGNHVRDYGTEALAYTLGEYQARGWGIFGAGANLGAANAPYLVEHNGNRLAFLGCNYAGPPYAWATEELPGSTPCNRELLFDTVTELNAEGHQVIFTYQWVERGSVAEDQREAFETAVEAGAVIVSGSQAHQPLPLTFYEGGFIHYGLGNLFFDQMQTTQLRSEVIDRHVFYAGQHISTELLTAFLESYAQPRPMTAEERAVLLDNLFESSGW
jgi:hypothetical protein